MLTASVVEFSRSRAPQKQPWNGKPRHPTYRDGLEDCHWSVRVPREQPFSCSDHSAACWLDARQSPCVNHDGLDSPVRCLIQRASFRGWPSLNDTSLPGPRPLTWLHGRTRGGQTDDMTDSPQVPQRFLGLDCGAGRPAVQAQMIIHGSRPDIRGQS